MVEGCSAINGDDYTAKVLQSSKPTYSPTQLSQYFARIGLPKHLYPTTSNLPTTLAFLTALQKHHLGTILFENLSLHYSTHHTISLDPSFLFDKIVTRGRGGYCMETNTFFAIVLRSLGFRVRGVGGRVWREGWGGFGHMVNIVTVDGGEKVMVDVGFGGNGPVEPMVLDAPQVRRYIGEAEVRVVWGGIEEYEDEGQRIWLYQYRGVEGEEWGTVYCFTEVEFLPQDYEVMSFWTSQCPKSWFTQRVVVVKMVVVEGEVVGTLSLSGGEVKRRGEGGTEVLRLCRGEGERVRALEENFGVRLTEEERRGIRGMVSELKG